MHISTPTFARHPSNNKFLQNEHFLSRNTLHPSEQMNVTESNLMEMKEMPYPRKTLQNKELEQDY
jgi:hypothetical protein